MLKAIRDSLLPFAQPNSEHETTKAQALEFFETHPQGNVAMLADALGSSKRSAERVVAELKEEGLLIRHGSPRAGSWEVVDR